MSERIKAVLALAAHYEQGNDAGFGPMWRQQADSLEDAVREELGSFPEVEGLDDGPCLDKGCACCRAHTTLERQLEDKLEARDTPFTVEALTKIIVGLMIQPRQMHALETAQGTKTVADVWSRWTLDDDHFAHIPAVVKRDATWCAHTILRMMRSDHDSD